MKIGIDYSLSSPGVCVNTSEGEFKYEDCTFYFLTNTKKYDATFKDLGSVRFIGSPHKFTKANQNDTVKLLTGLLTSSNHTQENIKLNMNTSIGQAMPLFK